MPKRLDRALSVTYSRHADNPVEHGKAVPYGPTYLRVTNFPNFRGDGLT